MDKNILKVYFICGTQDCPNGNALEIIEEALKSGVTIFQFREKGKNSLKGEDKKKFAIDVQKLCKKYNVPFIVNDDINLALELDADGVHIGQDDEDIELVREKFQNKIIGLSIGNIVEYENSKIEFADYIGVSPVFPTISKDDAGESVGLEFLKSLKTLNPNLPIVAIGGISLDNIEEVGKTGIDGAAVISMITRSENIQNVVAEIKKAIN